MIITTAITFSTVVIDIRYPAKWNKHNTWIAKLIIFAEEKLFQLPSNVLVLQTS